MCYNQSSILLDLFFSFEDLTAMATCRNDKSIIFFTKTHFIMNFSKYNLKMRCTSTSTEHCTITSVPGAEGPHSPGRQVSLLTRTFHRVGLPCCSVACSCTQGKFAKCLGRGQVEKEHSYPVSCPETTLTAPHFQSQVLMA